MSDLLRPPSKPFYEARAPRRRKRVISNYRPEYLARKRKELEDQLAKPVKDRVGKLRTLKSGDFTAEEVAEIAKRVRR